MFDVVGEENQKRLIQNALDNDKIAHAYLISGPDGTGKSIFAMHMASVIMCSGKVKPCGTCSSCIKLKKGFHPDVRVISENKKTIGIDMVRKIIEEVNVKPFEGSRKVIIIKKIDTMTVQGQNALLKTIEEPPIGTYIIMTAENDSMVLDTIKSRCQVIKFERVPESSIKKFLLENGTEENKASVAASLSDGIIGTALKYTDEKFIALRKETIENISGITTNKTLDALSKVDFFMKNKKNIDDILNVMSFWYRDVIMIKMTQNMDDIINFDYHNILVEESRSLSYNKLYGIIKIIGDTRDKINKHANFQLSIEVMLLNIQEV